MSDFVYGTDLEQRCIRPGWWGIEGHDVHRDHDGRWRIVYFGKEVHVARTLRAAREWIAERIEQRRV